ncbi:MAG: DUF4105 domain-containing protein [Bacteroidaceae bacterium]|nr:DUF4105 domain-containing protein [Bacteroidaceae bacterium]
MKKILFTLLLLTSSVCLFAQQLNLEIENQTIQTNPDSLQISILTCDPGPEVYALYGHMAIRYQNTNNGDDFVFNYGTFNMNAPFFIPKFTLGILDYELGCQPYEYFYRHYSTDGCKITMQVLNLTPEEKQRFFEALMTNYLPENRGYRYDFIYDNCATRPRDILEKIVDGEVLYSYGEQEVTYREMLHGFNGRWPWSKFGVDLVLGADADVKKNAREQEWIPSYLLEHFNQAKIKSADGSTRPLVRNTIEIPALCLMDESEEFPLSPMACAALLLSIGIAVSLFELLKKKIVWVWDLLVFVSQGLTGVILAILFFLSEHPCTGNNWLIVLFNPLPLFFLWHIIARGIQQRKTYYHLAYGVVLTLFMIFFAVIPQDIPIEVIPLALVLLLRHINHLIICKK